MKKGLLHSFFVLVFVLSVALVGCAGTSSYSRTSYLAPDGTAYAFTEISDYDLAADKILEQVSVSTVPSSEDELFQRTLTFDDYTMHANFYQGAVLIFFPSDLSYQQIEQITSKLCTAYDNVIKDSIMSKENGSSLLMLSEDLTREKYDAFIDTLKVKLKALTSEIKAQSKTTTKAQSQTSTQNKSQSQTQTTTQSQSKTSTSGTSSTGTTNNSGSASSTQQKEETSKSQSSSSSKTSSTQTTSASSTSSSTMTTAPAAAASAVRSSTDNQTATAKRSGLHPVVIVLIVLAAIALVIFVLKLIFG